MERINLYIYQETYTTYHSYFTWGEGMRESERVEYRDIYVYTDNSSLPSRLILDIKELVRCANARILSTREGISDLYKALILHTNNDLVSIRKLYHDEEDTKSLIDVNSLTSKDNGKSICHYYNLRPRLVTLKCFDMQGYTRLPLNDSPYNEARILEELGISFDETYLQYINKEHIRERLSNVLYMMFIGLLYNKLTACIAQVDQYDLEEIITSINKLCIDKNSSFRYLDKDTIDNCVEKIAHLCKDEFIQLKYNYLVSDIEYNTESSVLQILTKACIDKTEANLLKIEELSKQYLKDWLERRNYRETFWKKYKPDQIFTDRKTLEEYLSEHLLKEDENFDEVGRSKIIRYLMYMNIDLK